MAESRKLTVSQLNGYIKSVFDDELILHNIFVYGELTQLSVKDSVSYFTITEGDSYINCIMFSAMEAIEIGTQIMVFGRVNYFAKTGRVNFTVKTVSQIGGGEKYAELKKLKEKMEKEGLFSNRPQPPSYISRIAVITSETGAVIHDIMRVLRDKNVTSEVKLYPVSVQGDKAAAEIISAIKKVNSDSSDILIIARGGGSNYDLDVFNDEELARAVAASEVPVISAIGHETDYTLCDFCAGRRAGTPSIAASIIADINNSFLDRFSGAVSRISSAVDGIYSRLLSKAYCLSTSVVHAMDKHIDTGQMRILSALSRMKTAIDRNADDTYRSVTVLIERIENGTQHLLEASEKRLKSAVSVLECVSPLKTLARGFAKVTVSGKDVASVKKLNVGDNARVYFEDGVAEAKVTNIKVIAG